MRVWRRTGGRSGAAAVLGPAATMVALASALGPPLGAPLRAQEPPDTAPPERPFVEGGVYDKPYLTTLLGRAAIGGYAEAHARYNRVDGITEEAGFEAKRFNLFASTRVSDFVRLGAEIEIEEGGEELKLEFAAIDVIFHGAVALRAGMILSPIGRFNLAHDSPMNEFTDRPLVSTEVLGTALSEPGFGFLGTLPYGRGDGRFTYELYAVNGFHAGLIDASPDGTRIPLGRANFEDNNSSPALVGRLAWSPTPRMELGVSGHRGRYNRSEADGLVLDEARSVTLSVVDFDVTVLGLRISGEGALASVDVPPALRGIYAEDQAGLYTEVLWDFGRGLVATMPRSHFSIGARFDAVDFDRDIDGDAIAQVTLGLNFRPTAETALKFDLVRGRSWDRFRNPADHAGLQFSVATYF